MENNNFVFATYAARSANKFVYLEKDMEDSTSLLEELGIPEKSGLGDVLLNCGGIIINDVIRIFGASQVKRNIITWNKKVQEIGVMGLERNAIIVGDDIFGGQFAIVEGMSDYNFSGLFYFAPDTLQWEEFGPNLLNWLLKATKEDINEYFGYYFDAAPDLNPEEVDFDKTVSFYPLPFTKEFSDATPSRKIVDATEAYATLISIGSTLK